MTITTNRRPRTRGTVRAGHLPDGLAAAFHQRTTRARGHLLWTGPLEHDAVPTLTKDLHRYSVLTIAWVLHYGTDPVGKVIRDCRKPLCVAGRCLSDRTKRQQEQLLRAALLGIDLSGVCEHDHLRRDHSSVAWAGKVECRPCGTSRRQQTRQAERMGVPA
jgi:hypothetical protein